MTEATNYIQTSAAARILDCSREQVYRLVASGALRCVRTAAGVRLFVEADVLTLKRQREADPPRPGPRRRG